MTAMAEDDVRMTEAAAVDDVRTTEGNGEVEDVGRNPQLRA